MKLVFLGHIAFHVKGQKILMALMLVVDCARYRSTKRQKILTSLRLVVDLASCLNPIIWTCVRTNVFYLKLMYRHCLNFEWGAWYSSSHIFLIPRRETEDLAENQREEENNLVKMLELFSIWGYTHHECEGISVHSSPWPKWREHSIKSKKVIDSGQGKIHSESECQ